MAFGKINTPIVDDFVVTDGSGNPVPGIAPAAFSVLLYDPTGAEVSGTVTITITELGSGNYRVTFTPTALGDWKLVVTHPTYFPWGKRQNYTIYSSDFNDHGIGDRVVEITVEDSTTTNPIPAVWVQVYDTATTTLQAQGYTDSNGQISFMLFDGTYNVYLSKIGQYIFTVPETLTVVANPPIPDVQVTYQGDPFDPGSPPSSDTIIVYGWEQDAQGNGLAIEVSAEVVGDDSFLTSNPHISTDPITVTSDPSHINGPGYWSMTLFRSAEYASGSGTVLYKFTIGDMVETVELPDQASVALATLIDP